MFYVGGTVTGLVPRRDEEESHGDKQCENGNVFFHKRWNEGRKQIDFTKRFTSFELTRERNTFAG